MLRVKVSLVDSDPEIWRLLEVDSTLDLGSTHQVIQVAFGWWNVHLHSFTDTDPTSRRRSDDRRPRQWMPQALLDDDFDDGLPQTFEYMLETATAIGELLTETSGPLFYEYDFGDSWQHRLEFIERFEEPSPRALLVRGERAGPLEDSGGIHGYEQLLEALAVPSHERHAELREWVDYALGPWQSFDPERVDVVRINRELERLFEPPAAHSPIDALTEQLYPGAQASFRSYLTTALDGPAEVDESTAARMVRPFTWLMDRIGDDGLQLTAAGWLPPAVVSDAMRELGWEGRWIGKMNREDQTMPILQLRAAAQRLGLVRKQKGRLLLSNFGKKLRVDHLGLWRAIAAGAALRHRTDAEGDAALLLAVEVARGGERDSLELWEPVTFGLTALDWSAEDGSEVSDRTVRNLGGLTYQLFQALAVFELRRPASMTVAVTPEGQAFARAVLLGLA